MSAASHVSCRYCDVVPVEVEGSFIQYGEDLVLEAHGFQT